MSALFVPDGQTETLPIDSVDGLWPDGHTVEIRPPVGWEVERVINDPSSGPDFLEKHIVKWSLGEAVSKENISRLRSYFYTRLLAVVCGWAKDKDGKAISTTRNDSLKN